MASFFHNSFPVVHALPPVPPTLHSVLLPTVSIEVLGFPLTGATLSQGSPLTYHFGQGDSLLTVWTIGHPYSNHNESEKDVFSEEGQVPSEEEREILYRKSYKCPLQKRMEMSSPETPVCFLSLWCFPHQLSTLLHNSSTISPSTLQSNG